MGDSRERTLPESANRGTYPADKEFFDNGKIFIENREVAGVGSEITFSASARAISTSCNLGK